MIKPLCVNTDDIFMKNIYCLNKTKQNKKHVVEGVAMFIFLQMSLIMRLILKASPSVFRPFEFVVLVQVAEDI